MDTFSAFFMGVAVGAAIGMFIMAVVLAIGQLRDKDTHNTDNEVCSIDQNMGVMYINNDYDIEQVSDNRYIIKTRRK